MEAIDTSLGVAGTECPWLLTVVWLNSAEGGGPMLRSVKTLRFPRRDLRRVVLQPGVYKNKKKGHKSLHSK